MDAITEQNEVPFTIDELFFSRTDSRGIILSGNTVFRRISQYSWEELFKKPHNIIRHPDMPKGVFYLLWHFLKQGKPIGAYVKNRAKDGRHYWVFAIATPIEDGYLSVRLKPSSEFFGVVENAYKALLAYEKENNVSPKESMEYLFTVLKTLSFDSYDAFMSVALRMEVVSRNEKLGRHKENFLSCCEELSQHSTLIVKQTDSIFTAHEASQYVPMNLQIRAAQLGEEGRTIGVISQDFSNVSAEILSEINTFISSAREVFDKIYEGQFLLCTAGIQSEVVEFFRREHSENSSKEMELLVTQLKEYQNKSQEGWNAIVVKIDKFQEDCKRMRKCAANLEVVRVIGKVNASGLSKNGLHELLEELGTFQSTISQSLKEIEKLNSSMRSDTKRVLESLA